MGEPGHQQKLRRFDRAASFLAAGNTFHVLPKTELGGAHAVVKGDGDVVWARVLADCASGFLRQVYEGGRIEASQFLPARWELMPRDSYMWASVQTVRGCPKHCSFCSVWRTDGQRPRQRASDLVIQEIIELRRWPMTTSIRSRLKIWNWPGVKMPTTKSHKLQAIRDERLQLMARLAELPKDMVFFTQITMEAAEDPEFLEAMRRARIKGALVGVETVTPEGLKAIFKEFNSAGRDLVQRLRTFRQHGVHVLGSFIFGLPTDRPDTFQATAALAAEADLTFAQFVLLTPFPGTVDFQRWEKLMESDPTRIGGFPLTRYWLIPQALRPKVYMSHPLMSAEEIRWRSQDVWDRFYALRSIWKRSSCVKSLRSRLAFVFISKLYRQMYANTGIASDSARANRANRWARWLAKPCLRLFQAPPMPELS